MKSSFQIKDQLLQAVYECEGLNAAEIATLTDNDRSVSNSNLIRLCQEGLLRREVTQERIPHGNSFRMAAVYRYYKGTGEPDAVAKHERKPRTQPKSKVTEVGWEARYNQLWSEHVELQAWKARAIERYPDLQVSEDVLRARRIAAKANPDFAKALLAGEKDNSPIMLAVLAAIEEMAA